MVLVLFLGGYEMKVIEEQMPGGSVETLLLAVLDAGPNYGYAIIKELNARANGILHLGEGTAYPVLYRLEEKKLVSSEWRLVGNGRNRKYYRLNSKGRRVLAANRQQWRRLALLMKRFSGSAPRLSPRLKLERVVL